MEVVGQDQSIRANSGKAIKASLTEGPTDSLFPVTELRLTGAQLSLDCQGF